MDIKKTTIAGNFIRVIAGGGVANSGTLKITNSTISHNEAGSSSAEGGGISNGGPGSKLELQNTIVALNTTLSVGPDCFGPITSLGNNIMAHRVIE
jgi:hypothetical protein